MSGNSFRRLSDEEMQAAQQQVIGLLTSIAHGQSDSTIMMLEDWNKQTTIVMATLTLGLIARANDGNVDEWLQKLAKSVLYSGEEGRNK